MDSSPVPTDRVARSRKRQLVRLSVFPAVLLAGGLTWSYWPFAGPQSGTKVAAGASIGAAQQQNTDNSASGQPLNADQRMTAAIVGHWVTDRTTGHRELTIREDGTALMIVEVDSFVSRLAFGPKMEIDIEWSISDGILHFKMVGGRPRTSIDMLTKVGGDSLAYPILILNEERLLVKDGGSDPDHDWTRARK